MFLYSILVNFEGGAWVKAAWHITDSDPPYTPSDLSAYLPPSFRVPPFSLTPFVPHSLPPLSAGAAPARPSPEAPSPSPKTLPITATCHMAACRGGSVYGDALTLSTTCVARDIARSPFLKLSFHKVNPTPTGFGHMLNSETRI